MLPVGPANIRISTGYAQKSPRSLVESRVFESTLVPAIGFFAVKFCVHLILFCVHLQPGA